MSAKDQYSLQQSSPQPTPGFVLFQNEKNQQHYFHCNDVNGRPFLYSQAYQSARTAEVGLQSVLRNAGKKNRYQKMDHTKGTYFVLKAGNHQEIARSKHFKTDKALQQAIDYLQQVASSEQPMAIATQPRRSKTKSKAPIHPTQRFAFQLELYDREDSQPRVAGVIHNLS
ncbi:MAG: DUF1508 domain-containing protein, partial [Bacteroidota bacterium]